MTRVRLGEIIEIGRPSGLAYAQYINRRRMYGALLRVYSTIHPARPLNPQGVLNGEVQFVCFFPLQAAVNQDVVTVVAHAPVPPDSTAMPVFRNGVMDPRTGKVAVWWFWDGEAEWQVGALTDAQKRMPILGCWNDTLLVERIVSGWRPENDPTA